MSLEKSLQFLVVAPDRSVEEEFDVAAQGVKGWRCLPTFVQTQREGVELARMRQPDFVLVEMGQRVAEVRAFAEEIGVVSPETCVVAVYRRQTFPDAEVESNAIIEALRARVVDFLRRPLSSAEVEHLIDRHRREGPAAPGRSGAALGKVVSFISNKGGVGKSTISTNVACELARRNPGRVLLVDASLQLGVCASMLDLEPATTITDAAQQLDRLDTTLLQQLTIPHDSGLRVLAAPPTVLAASEVDDRVVSRVLSLSRRSYDYVIVDTFPVVDGVVMAILDLSNVACIVTQVLVPVLNGTASLLETTRQLGVDAERLWVILNHGQPRFSGELKVSDVEGHLRVAVRHDVPYERRIPVSVNLGRPAVFHASRFSGFRRAIGRIADDIEALSDAGGARPPSHKAHPSGVVTVGEGAERPS